MFHYEILDSTRKRLLPQRAEVGNGFYLSGGTALAIQLGHRDSFHFNFFTGGIDTSKLYENVKLFLATKIYLSALNSTLFTHTFIK